jgi:hypothetical protein
MPKAKPIIHTELIDAEGHQIVGADELTLSGSQFDWLAEFFAPIVKKSFEGGGQANAK